MRALTSTLLCLAIMAGTVAAQTPKVVVRKPQQESTELQEPVPTQSIVPTQSAVRKGRRTSTREVAASPVDQIVGTWQEQGCRTEAKSELRPLNPAGELVQFDTSQRYRSEWNDGKEDLISVGRWKHAGNGRMLELSSILVNGQPIEDKFFRVYQLTKEQLIFYVEDVPSCPYRVYARADSDGS